jgi:hypothetical protein
MTAQKMAPNNFEPLEAIPNLNRSILALLKTWF